MLVPWKKITLLEYFLPAQDARSIPKVLERESLYTSFWVYKDDFAYAYLDWLLCQFVLYGK